MPDADEFGARVAVLREQRALTQEEFAQALRLGWSQSDVSKLERGTKTINIHQLIRVAEVLAVSVAALFEEPAAELPLPVLTPELRRLLLAGAGLPPHFQIIVTQHARQLQEGLSRYLPAPIA